MNFRILLPLFLAAMIVGTASCSKDETPSDPQGTVTLNMYNEKNGKTLLGNSDVYINASNNFRTSSYSLADLGRKSGLGAIGAPAMKQLSSEVAAQPGHGYLIFRDEAVREFKSGALALAITADYYKVYVNSAIERDGQTVGAVVGYLLSDVADYGLPEYDRRFVWELWAGEYYDLMLPTSDFEYELQYDGTIFKSEKKGRRLRLEVIDYSSVGFENDYELYLRIRGSYTRVTFQMRF